MLPFYKEKRIQMASWIVHLRITDKLLDEIPGLSPCEFVVGNIAPDSGVPNEDWSRFTPSGDVSHFKTADADGLKDIHINEYVRKFYTPGQRDGYSSKQKSFYLGYLSHLLTDMLWADDIVRPSKVRFRALYEKDMTEWIWTLKKDWYDLDYLYIKRNPEFRAFSIYKNAVGFRNDYMDIFGAGAFENRRKYIVDFYSGESENLEREYTYLKEEEMEVFVDESTDRITQIMKKEYLV
jgi:hypothetical protein